MVPTKFMMTKMAISGSRGAKLIAQPSGRNGLSEERSKRVAAVPLRDSGRTNSASAKLPAFSSAATMNGARTQISPRNPPSTGPMMKPMPNMAWK